MCAAHCTSEVVPVVVISWSRSTLGAQTRNARDERTQSAKHAPHAQERETVHLCMKWQSQHANCMICMHCCTELHTQHANWLAACIAAGNCTLACKLHNWHAIAEARSLNLHCMQTLAQSYSDCHADRMHGAVGCHQSTATPNGEGPSNASEQKASTSPYHATEFEA